VKYLPLFHHFEAIYQFPKHIICLVKIAANASLNKTFKFGVSTKYNHFFFLGEINSKNKIW
jgi:hypothetical protein